MSSHQTIYVTAREIGDSRERSAYMDQACAGDAGLRGKVEALLADDQAARDFFAEVETKESPVERIPLPAASTQLMPEQIGPYRILERLGHGGMGEVYRAEQRVPIRREVALKLIKLGMDTKQVVARFEAERQAMALMDHPHIAKVYGADADEKGRPYFAMEYVKGIPITEYADINHLTIKERLELFQQVCHAIQHAHQKGVIHRDIKPSNILVSTQDGRPHAKVIDFGIAKATSQQLTDKTLFTLHDQFIGTPQYMSPEQATGSLDIDTRSDVYSLGVLLYELLTGHTPFDTAKLKKAALHEVARILRDEEPPKPSTRLGSLSTTMGKISQSTATGTLATLAKARSMDAQQLVKEIRGELDWMVMKAVEKDRARRYDSPGSLSEDVGRYLSGAAVKAAPPSWSYRAGKFMRRHRGPLALAGTALLVLVTAGVLTVMGIARERTSRLAALEAREEALRARAQADEIAVLAGKQSAELHFGTYREALQTARNAISSGDTVAALAALDSCPEPLRGWEWRCLSAMADSSLHRHPYPPGSKLDAVSSDGSHAALLGGDARELIVWNAAGGTVVGRVAIPDVIEVLSTSVSRGGERVTFTAVNSKGPSPECRVTVYVWDRTANAVIWSYESKVSQGYLITHRHVSISGNGRRVLVWGNDVPLPADGNTNSFDYWDKGKVASGGGRCRVFEVLSDGEGVRMEDGPGCEARLGFSGEKIIGNSSASNDRNLHTWDTQSGKSRKLDLVGTFRSAPDTGTDVITGTPEGWVVFDENTGEQTSLQVGGEILLARNGYVRDGGIMVGLERNNSIRVAAVGSDDSRGLRMAGTHGDIQMIAVDQAAGVIRTFTDKEAVGFPLPSRPMLDRIDSLQASAENHSGHVLVAPMEKLRVAKSPHDGATLGWFNAPPSPGSPGNCMVDLGSSGKVVRIHRRNGKAYTFLMAVDVPEGLTPVAAVSDSGGTRIAIRYRAADEGGAATRIFELPDPVARFEIPDAGGEAGIPLGFGRRTFWMLSGSEIRAFQVPGGAEVEFSGGRPEGVPSLSPDGRFLACISGTLISLHDADDGRLVRSWKVSRAADGRVEWIADGRRLLCHGNDSVTICDPDRGAVLFEGPKVDGRIPGPLGYCANVVAAFDERPLRERWSDMLAVERLESDPQLTEWGRRKVEGMYRSGKSWESMMDGEGSESLSILHRIGLSNELVRAKREFDEKISARMKALDFTLPLTLLEAKLAAEPDQRLRSALMEALGTGYAAKAKVPWEELLDPETSPERLHEIFDGIKNASEGFPSDLESNALKGAAAYRLGDHAGARAFFTAIPWVASPEGVQDWALHTRLMAFLAMTEFRLGARESAVKALRVALHFWEAEKPYNRIQTEAALLVDPAALDLPQGSASEARREAAGAITTSRMRLPGTEGITPQVDIRGKVVRVTPTLRGIGANVLLDSMDPQKGVLVWIDMREGKVPEMDMGTLLGAVGKEITVQGKAGFYGGNRTDWTNWIQVSVRKIGDISIPEAPAGPEGE